MTISTSFIAILLYVYAAVLVFGGVFGFLKAQSTPSLIAGVGSAVLAVVAALLVPHHPRAGLGLSIIVSLALELFFLRRFQETKKAMPALPVIAVSGIVFIIAASKLFTAILQHHS